MRKTHALLLGTKPVSEQGGLLLESRVWGRHCISTAAAVLCSSERPDAHGTKGFAANIFRKVFFCCCFVLRVLLSKVSLVNSRYPSLFSAISPMGTIYLTRFFFFSQIPANKNFIAVLKSLDLPKWTPLSLVLPFPSTFAPSPFCCL